MASGEQVSVRLKNEDKNKLYNCTNQVLTVSAVIRLGFKVLIENPNIVQKISQNLDLTKLRYAGKDSQQVSVRLFGEDRDNLIKVARLLHPEANVKDVTRLAIRIVLDNPNLIKVETNKILINLAGSQPDQSGKI